MKSVATYIHTDSSVTKDKYDYVASLSELDYACDVDSFQAFVDKKGVFQFVISKPKGDINDKNMSK